ncbi:hypothetical protein PS691_03254 [Pseudomonas fluorescens]|uniref:Uncharacterized protein n=1 Tax=Pseudomonas fluorescens TaxID=294 RepID=A0A5E7CVC1_PSEFL|nr:hypothetical protein PS691_03254 [Pseudomonas fluorescens]
MLQDLWSTQINVGAEQAPGNDPTMNDNALVLLNLVAAAELREAAFGREAVVKPGNAFCQAIRIRRFCEDFVLERSLAELGSCYGRGSAVVFNVLCSQRLQRIFVVQRLFDQQQPQFQHLMDGEG